MHLSKYTNDSVSGKKQILFRYEIIRTCDVEFRTEIFAFCFFLLQIINKKEAGKNAKA